MHPLINVLGYILLFVEKLIYTLYILNIVFYCTDNLCGKI